MPRFEDGSFRRGFSPRRIDPTTRGDTVASMVRAWYERNRETTWDRYWRRSDTADNFMIGLVNAVHAAEKQVDECIGGSVLRMGEDRYGTPEEAASTAGGGQVAAPACLPTFRRLAFDRYGPGAAPVLPGGCTICGRVLANVEDCADDRCPLLKGS
jgi:hypothetical protein